MTLSPLKLQVSLGERSYPIFVRDNLLASIGETLQSLCSGRTIAVITNDTVAAFYYATLNTALVAAGFTVHKVSITDGEEYKNSQTLNAVYDELFAAGLDRGGLLVALGGGVVGDLAGYAAATFMRGIPFVQVPTTLLAQVDSSVGGKTGINHPRGKNLIGAFHQPLAVFADVSTLLTLNDREYCSGLAEVVKYGMALDADFFGFLEERSENILARELSTLQQIVIQSCRLKAQIVEQDEREGGLRAVLNYGHTFGHAVETLTGYQQFSHGEAVAIGMVQAARISVMRGLSEQATVDRLVNLLRRFNLPVTLPQYPADSYDAVMRMDKKVREGALTFVLNRGIGAFVLQKENDVLSLAQMLTE